MKSQAEFMLQLACGILQDAELAYPNMSADLGRDRNTLTRITQSRGIGVFTLDLPALDGHLLDGLQAGRLIPKPNVPLSGLRSKRIQVPRLFSGLWLRVFDSDGRLLPLEAIDQNSILFLRQLFCIGKKLELPCAQHRVDKALGEYYAIERSIRPPTLKWGEEDPFEGVLPSESCWSDMASLIQSDSKDSQEIDVYAIREQKLVCSPRTEWCIQRVADAIMENLPTLDLDIFFDEEVKSGSSFGFRHGPGVTSDTSRGISKYSFPSWSKKLNRVFPERVFLFEQGTRRQSERYEAPSKLIRVPKTAKSPRLIAAESAANQFCQQWLRSRLEQSTKKGGSLYPFIDFSSQERSRELARRGSLTGELCTIDLSSASDRLSCYVVERIFRKRPDYIRALNAVRTSHLFIEEDEKLLKLKKFASQGSAVTFPVQTIVFQIIALGVLLKHNWRGRLLDCDNPTLISYLHKMFRGKTRVFGDDIVVPKYAYASMCNVLDVLGLKVNRSKSFGKGNFRESCGGDFYYGACVAPVRLRYAHFADPVSRQSLLESINLLFKKGFWKTSEILRMEMYKMQPYVMRQLPVIAPGSGFTGLASFCGSSIAHLKVRWNASLQREEARVCRFYTRAEIRRREGLSCLLQFMVDDPVGQQVTWKSGDLSGRPPVLQGAGWAPLWVISS